MLIEFKAKNYKSFKDEMIFSMMPAPKQHGLNYSILKTNIDKNEYKSLCSAVIYGPNAAGKSNIISAMDTLKSIIARGNIINSHSYDEANIASGRLELIPNSKLENSEPVEISIKFIDSNILFEYKLVMDIGSFLSEDYNRQIIEETLLINDNLIFDRKSTNLNGNKLTIINAKNNFVVKNFTSIQEYMIDDFANSLEITKSLATNSLNSKELFLTNGFKNIFSPQLVDIITNWFEEKFRVIYSSHFFSIRKKDVPKETIYKNMSIDAAANMLGIASDSLGFTSLNEGDDAELCSILKIKNKLITIPAEIFESYGTTRLIAFLPPIINILQEGGTLVIDEFDASIHPMILMNLLNVFHNDNINIKKAQLIFNTHNPIFLNHNILRRDEIKFVERDENTSFSKHYSLSDFGTSGVDGVRKGGDYMKKYFINEYGAIKNIDLTPIFEAILLDKEV